MMTMTIAQTNWYYHPCPFVSRNYNGWFRRSEIQFWMHLYLCITYLRFQRSRRAGGMVRSTGGSERQPLKYSLPCKMACNRNAVCDFVLVKISLKCVMFAKENAYNT
eukprot:PhF_6_TR27956/c0_g1_i1/m.41261